MGMVVERQVLKCIFAMKRGHEGRVSYVNEGKLIFSYEEEKNHSDGFARCQPVGAFNDPRMDGPLRAFKNWSGVAVLCNTSLNFRGAGFINHFSDLARYALTVSLDGLVVDDTYYRRVRRGQTLPRRPLPAPALERC